MTPALAFRHVTKRFGSKVALSDVSLALPPGSFLGLVGRNGAGKSTLIKLATTLLEPSEGSITVLGHDLRHDALAARRHIGVMPEDMALLELLSGAQYLRFVGRMYGLATAEIDHRSAELFELLDLKDDARSVVADYSFGMKKKLAFAAAVIHGPELLFLDEPFEGVDAVASSCIKEILSSLSRRGVTVVLSTHVLEVVERLCPLLAILDAGQLKSFGPADELLDGETSLEAFFVKMAGAPLRVVPSWL
jgi:ABC-2 type transport system ATP-binding protein